MSIHKAISTHLALRLKRLAGAHRLGNISQSQLESQRTDEIQNAQQLLASLARIPSNLSAVTYFSQHDWWGFQKSNSPHMCHVCDFFGDIYLFNGTDIRGTFPRLTIIDENTIEPNVHPHCGCSLVRLSKYEA
jgi:hypothetical protein